MSNLNVTFTGDEQDLRRALGKIIDENKRLGRELKKIRKGSEQLGMSGKRVFNKMLSSARGLVGGLIGGGGVMGAIQMVNSELDNMRTRQAAAFGTQQSVSQARQNLIRMMGGESEETTAKTLERAGELSLDLAVDEAVIANAIASAISGGASVEEALSAVEQSAKFLRDTPSEIAGFAGALVDMAKVSGTKDAEVNQGLLQQLAATSRIEGFAGVAKNAPSALFGATSNGATIEEAVSLFSALTQGAGDRTGEQSRTALIGLTAQLDEFFRENKNAKAIETAAGRELTIGEQLEALQGDSKLAEKFLDGASFEKAFQAPIRDLVNGVGFVTDEFNDNMNSIGTTEGLKEAAQNTVNRRNLDDLEKEQLADAKRDAAKGKLKVLDDTASQGAAREDTAEILQASGAGFFERNAAWVASQMVDLFGGDQREVGATNLKNRADAISPSQEEFKEYEEIRGQFPSFMNSLADMFLGAVPDPKNTSDNEKERAEILRGQAEEMRAQAEESKTQTGILKDIANNTKQEKPTPNPRASE